jgi:hypothetical protein
MERELLVKPSENNNGKLILNPEDCRLDPERTAQIMMEILAANYGQHNLTNDISPLIADIKSNRIQPFIGLDEEQKPAACAALIKLSEHDTEIGRGACIPKKNGGGNGIPLLVAAEAWFGGKIFPESRILRAEVRTAKPTKEVPGGLATQVICLDKIGLSPTGLGPLFHHGIPDRQEMFILASRFRDPSVLEEERRLMPTIPASLFSSEAEREVFSFFWQNYFGARPDIQEVNCLATEEGFRFCPQGPLLVLTPSEDGIRNLMPNIEESFNNGVSFALGRIPLTENIYEVISQTQSLKRLRFGLVGFEPVLVNGRLEVHLLLGKLSTEGKVRLVLPSFTEGIFPHEIEDLLTEMSIRWRR